MIQRRHFTNMLLAAPLAAAGCSADPPTSRKVHREGFSYQPGVKAREPLVAPQGRPIRVAFAINPGVQVIDLAGPWETFQDTYASPEAEEPAFELFTVSENSQPVRGSGGLKIIPDYAIDNTPSPDVVVVPHFDRPNPRTHDTSAIHRWIKETHVRAALTMSICTGAFQLAKTGLLDGVPMTTINRPMTISKGRFPRWTCDGVRGSSRPAESPRPAASARGSIWRFASSPDISTKAWRNEPRTRWNMRERDGATDAGPCPGVSASRQQIFGPLL